jgi:hypothetical protein
VVDCEQTDNMELIKGRSLGLIATAVGRIFSQNTFRVIQQETATTDSQVLHVRTWHDVASPDYKHGFRGVWARAVTISDPQGNILGQTPLCITEHDTNTAYNIVSSGDELLVALGDKNPTALDRQAPEVIAQLAKTAERLIAFLPPIQAREAA